MKNRFKAFALFVSFLLIFSLLTPNTAVSGSSLTETADTECLFVVPDIIEKDEAEQHVYTSRAEEYENDLYTLCFRDSDGSLPFAGTTDVF